MSQMTSTAKAISSAANTPVTCDRRRTTEMYASIGVFLRGVSGNGPRVWQRADRGRLLHLERFVDQLLAVRHFVGEALVAALPRHVEPRVVVGVGQRDDF